MSTLSCQPPSQPRALRRAAFSVVITLLVAASAAPHAHAQVCTKEQIAEAVDKAGAALRKVSGETTPRIEAKMRQLKESRGWSSSEAEERAFATIQDERVAKLDATANELLARIDTLSSGGTADCARLTEVEAVSIELQATVRAKANYVLSRLDAVLSDGKTPAPKADVKAPDAKSADAKTMDAKPTTRAPDPAPKASSWSTAIKEAPKAPPAATAPPAPKVAANAPSNSPQTPTPQQPLPPLPIYRRQPPRRCPPRVSPATKSSPPRPVCSARSRPISARLSNTRFRPPAGRPVTSSATKAVAPFIAGLRYGKGTLYLRTGEQVPIFWHGPSLGADFGASGAKVMFLVYKLAEPQDVFTSFTGVEGSAYVVGGLGMTFMSNGRIQMAPIRSGIGLRLGANVGYMRFTPRPTWNPF